jgi:hypothetical protein
LYTLRTSWSMMENLRMSSDFAATCSRPTRETHLRSAQRRYSSPISSYRSGRRTPPAGPGQPTRTRSSLALTLIRHSLPPVPPSESQCGLDVRKMTELSNGCLRSTRTLAISSMTPTPMPSLHISSTIKTPTLRPDCSKQGSAHRSLERRRGDASRWIALVYQQPY